MTDYYVKLNLRIPGFQFDGAATVSDATYPVEGIFFGGEANPEEWIYEGFSLGDSQTIQETQSVTETLVLLDETVFGQVSLITETVVFDGALIDNEAEQLESAIYFADEVEEQQITHFTESFVFLDEAAPDLSFQLTENIFFGDLATAVGSSTYTVEENFVLTDAVVSTAGQAEVTDTFALLDEVTPSRQGNAQLDETLTFDDLVENAWGVSLQEVDETIVFDGEVEAVVSIVTAALKESFTLLDAIWARDVSVLAWVLNTESGGLSRYTNFGYTSITQHNGVVYATSPEGIFAIDDGTDNSEAIDASFTTGLLDLGQDYKKRISSVYLGHHGGDLECTVETYDSRDEGVYTYDIEERVTDAPRNTRIRVGKGLTSRYWRFTFKNVAGADFQVNDIAVDVGTSSRRL